MKLKLSLFCVLLTGTLLFSNKTFAQWPPDPMVDPNQAAMYYSAGLNAGTYQGYYDGYFTGIGRTTVVNSFIYTSPTYKTYYDEGFWATYGVNFYQGMEDKALDLPCRLGGQNPNRPKPNEPM